MRRTWAVAAAVVLVVGAVAGVVVMTSPKQATPSAQGPHLDTAKVELGNLSAMVSLFGTLSYRARSDGSPYAVINQAQGTYTQLPNDGDQVACGDELYRVDDQPVLLLCGTVPAYRALHAGDVGNDVRQLNQNLHALGYDAGLDIDPTDKLFTSKTQKALEKLQHDTGVPVTGTLEIGEAGFLPEPARIATVTGELGGPADPGVQVLEATSDTPEVQVALDPSQQGEVKEGDAAQITLPGNLLATGKVDRLGTVAQVPAGPTGNAAGATIPAYISLDDPAAARGFDAAPVQVDITTEGMENVLSVPVTALVGRAGGGYAVEVVRADGRHELVAVRLGLFDTSAGRVQVEGGVHEGDQVVVPSP
jgi:peptidoglycan hydrolase-like protein with peptidoglycan-binding domain